MLGGCKKMRENRVFGGESWFGDKTSVDSGEGC